MQLQPQEKESLFKFQSDDLVAHEVIPAPKNSPDLQDEPLIIPEYIDRPDLQSRAKRGVWGAINLMGWLVWIYLLLPLISILAWLFGYQRFHAYMLMNQPGSNLHTPIFLIIILSSLLLLWAIYNWLRFRKKERLHYVDNASIEQIAHFYEIESQLVHRVQRQQVSTFHYDDIGKIINIT